LCEENYFEGRGPRQRGRPRKIWKEVADKEMNDCLLKLSDAMDHGKWTEMIRGKWSDRNIDSDAVN